MLSFIDVFENCRAMSIVFLRLRWDFMAFFSFSVSLTIPTRLRSSRCISFPRFLFPQASVSFYILLVSRRTLLSRLIYLLRLSRSTCVSCLVTFAYLLTCVAQSELFTSRNASKRHLFVGFDLLTILVDDWTCFALGTTLCGSLEVSQDYLTFTIYFDSIYTTQRYQQ